MPYVRIKDGPSPAAASPSRAICLGEAERQVIVQARHDAQARKPGVRIADPRLEALRLYAMLGRYRHDAVQPLHAAGFSFAERHVIDAMLDALPPSGEEIGSAIGRLILAGAILVPLLIATGLRG